MFASLFVGCIGAVFVIVGLLIGKKEKISLLHSYHYDKVSAADKTAFCRLSGLGVTFIGIGLLGTAVLLAVTNALWSFILFAAGFAAGLALVIYAGCKYNTK